MMRLNLIKGLGPVLQIAEGWTVEIDPEIHQKLNMRTDPTWPTTWSVSYTHLIQGKYHISHSLFVPRKRKTEHYKKSETAFIIF